MLEPPVDPFRVAFVTGVTPTKWLRIWRERYPDAPLELVPVEQADQLAVLADGRADAGFVRLPVDAEGLTLIPLYEEQQFVVAPADHAIEAMDAVTLADLDGENILTGVERDVVELVATGVGVGLMPQSISRMFSRRDVISRPVSDGGTTRIALGWLADADSDAIQDFMGIVRGRTAASSRGARDGEPGATEVADKAAKAARVAANAAKAAARAAAKKGSAGRKPGGARASRGKGETRKRKR